MTLALALCVGAIFMIDFLITIFVARPAAPRFERRDELSVNAAATERVLLQEIVPLPAPPGGEEVSVDPYELSVEKRRPRGQVVRHHEEGERAGLSEALRDPHWWALHRGSGPLAGSSQQQLVESGGAALLVQASREGSMRSPWLLSLLWSLTATVGDLSGDWAVATEEHGRTEPQ